MKAIVDVLSSPIRRVRMAATLFSVTAGGSCATLMDAHLPAPRLALAYLALAVIIIIAVVTFARDQVHWWSVVLSGPLVGFAAVGLRDKPSTIALALSLLAGQTLYGTTRMAVVRTGVVASCVLALVIAAPLTDGPHEPPSAAVVPVIVIVLFSLVLRLLYAAMHVHETAARREALMAATSRALLESADIAEAETIVRSSLEQLARDTDGLDTTVSTVASASSAGGLTLAFPSTGEEVVVSGPKAMLAETQSFLESLAAQLALVRGNHEAHRELFAMAHHDLLTSLSNRRAFFLALTDSVESVVEPHTVGVMLIDLDDFKQVNDTHGHGAGDAVLIEVGRRMVAAVGEHAVVARFGGDEFAVLIQDSGTDALDDLAQTISRSVRRPIAWGRRTVAVGASIGIAVADSRQSPGDLMRLADLAMYEAKSLGKNQVVRHRSSLADHR